ncbi:MAG: HNH endonuclease [Anaerolineae bacterium]|nr:HNH endonuclease [Anaerolineae bacterium]
MSELVSTRLRQLVIKRANNQCEYCRLHETVSPFSHEVDHLIARKHGGQTVAENLALSCLPCNRRKGSDLTTIDPVTATVVPLFNPRVQRWADHFVLRGAAIEGLTPIGRGTVFLLALNTPDRLARREALIPEGLYP